MIMNKILFTADLHFGHTNILKHQPNRPFAQEVDTKAHDEYMLDLWKSSVGKRDLVYILGDLTFFKSEDALSLLRIFRSPNAIIRWSRGIRSHTDPLCSMVTAMVS